MTKTKTPTGYEYKGVAIIRKTWSFYGRKQRGAYGHRQQTVFAIEGVGSFTRLADALAHIDQQEPT